MAGFIDEFIGSFGPEVTEKLSSSLNIKKDVASQILPQVAPLILGGLKKQMQDRGGADRVDHILNKYGSASVLSDIGSLFDSQARDDKPDPRLGGLLGDSGVHATELISNQHNLDQGTASKIIPMLAPVLLGALTQKRDAQGVGSQGIAALLDQDGDGQILDDVAGFLMKQISGSGSQKGGSFLGGLIDGFLRKK